MNGKDTEIRELDKVLPCRPVPDMSGFVPGQVTREELDAMLDADDAVYEAHTKEIEKDGHFVSTSIFPLPKKRGK